MEFRDSAAKETSALVARLFAESAENSRQRLAAFRTAINNATKALETAIGSAPQFERDVTDLVNRLAKAATAEAEAAAERVAVEAKAATEAVRAELKTESRQREALAASLQDAKTKLEALQSELEAEKQRSETARREVSDAHDALKKLEAARVEAVANFEKETKTRAAAEAELQRLRRAIDALRTEAAGVSDQLEAAIAEKARLEEALAAAQSQAEANEAKLATVTTLFKQASTRVKTLEKENETAVRELTEQHAIALRELEATHQSALIHAVKEAEATSEAALRELELNHMNAIRDLETRNTITVRQIEAEHGALQRELEARYAAAQRELESQAAAYRELEAQIHASANTAAAAPEAIISRIDDLLEGFHALAAAGTVADVLATLVEHLAAEFSRVALFHVRGNRLEGANQIGFEFDHDIAKLVFPLGLDSMLTRAVLSGRVERVSGHELADSGIAPFGGSPTCALALPLVVAGETIAIVYADDSGRTASELSTRFAGALLQHSVALLTRLNNELRLLAELRGYATSLLAEMEELYAADVAAGKAGNDLQSRLRNNLDFARSIYATRIETEGLEAAPLFEEQLAALIDTRADTPFGRDLAALAGRADLRGAHRKAEAS